MGEWLFFCLCCFVVVFFPIVSSPITRDKLLALTMNLSMLDQICDTREGNYGGKSREKEEHCLFMASFYHINPFPLILQLHQIETVMALVVIFIPAGR